MGVKTPLPLFQIRLPKLLFLGPDLSIFIKYNVLWIVWLLFDMVWWTFNGSKSWWNKPVFHNFWKQNNKGLFHQLFEPLKIHQTILNSNQTIHKNEYNEYILATKQMFLYTSIHFKWLFSECIKVIQTKYCRWTPSNSALVSALSNTF